MLIYLSVHKQNMLYYIHAQASHKTSIHIQPES